MLHGCNFNKHILDFSRQISRIEMYETSETSSHELCLQTVVLPQAGKIIALIIAGKYQFSRTKKNIPRLFPDFLPDRL